MKVDRFVSVFIVVAFGIIAGIVVTLLSDLWPSGNAAHNLLQSLGVGLLTTAFIGLVLDLLWSKERAKAEKEEFQPLFDELSTTTKKLADTAGQLEVLENRYEAFEKLGLNRCHSKRNDALKTFFIYAKEIIPTEDSKSANDTSDVPSGKTISIVSSSARGLIGYLDRDPQEVQSQWRELITTRPGYFRILLTHPAFAHLRQPAEERSFGDIELEILKTSVYLHCVAGMHGKQFRFYRGSPTVFAIQIGKHILLNPYPYGQMAMDTLCLEFAAKDEQSYVSKFMNMHFNHTWAFIRQPSKLVDRKPLVVGINEFDDILTAFSECTFLNRPKLLRLTKAQINELDEFTCKTLGELNPRFAIEPPKGDPFMTFVRKNGFLFSDDEVEAKDDDQSSNGTDDIGTRNR